MLTLSGPGRTAAPYRLRAWCPFRLPDRFAEYSRNTHLTPAPGRPAAPGPAALPLRRIAGLPGPPVATRFDRSKQSIPLSSNGRLQGTNLVPPASNHPSPANWSARPFSRLRPRPATPLDTTTLTLPAMQKSAFNLPPWILCPCLDRPPPQALCAEWLALILVSSEK